MLALGQASLRATEYTEYNGLKITMRAQLGQIMSRQIPKGQNPAAIFEVPGAKAGYSTTRGWADHLSCPSGPTPDLPPPSPHLRD